MLKIDQNKDQEDNIYAPSLGNINQGITNLLPHKPGRPTGIPVVKSI